MIYASYLLNIYRVEKLGLDLSTLTQFFFQIRYALMRLKCVWGCFFNYFGLKNGNIMELYNLFTRFKSHYYKISFYFFLYFSSV